MESPHPARRAGRHAAAGAPDAGFHPQRVARHSDRELRGALASLATQEPDLRRATGSFPVLADPEPDLRRMTGPFPVLADPEPDLRRMTGPFPVLADPEPDLRRMTGPFPVLADPEPDLRRMTGPFPVLAPEPDLRRMTGPFPVLAASEPDLRRMTGPFPALVSQGPSWAAAGPAADQAMVRLYRRNFNALVRLASVVLRDTATAEEVVQDAFINMHRGWHRLRDEENALAYLRQAVVNRARSVLRHRVIVERNAPKAMPDLPSAEDGAISMFERSAVIDALRDLPGRQREALILRYYADLSEAEIAAAMGISKGSVKSHTARGMMALRTALENF
jgi:RNA polymerase sigma-70 factor (sigma-E family)